MKKADAEKAILARWYLLPAEERQTVAQAYFFASKIMHEFPFRSASSNREKEIKNLIARDQALRVEPLKE